MLALFGLTLAYVSPIIRALIGQGLVVLYQPQVVNLADHGLVGAEAPARCLIWIWA